MKMTLRTMAPLGVVLLFLLSACEKDLSGLHTDGMVEPLTVASAQDWYNQTVASQPQLRSTSDDAAAVLTPEWNIAELFSDSVWYVVESPLQFTGDIQMRIMNPKTSEGLGEHERFAARQITRLIVMRNKEDGTTYTFMMVVIPDFEYMWAKGNVLEETKYLTPNSDLDGTILYYNPDGTFVNGWVFEKGIPVMEIEGMDDDTDAGMQLRALVKMEVVTDWWQTTDGGKTWTYGGSTTSYYYTSLPVTNSSDSSYGLVNVSGLNTGGGNTNQSKTTPLPKSKQPTQRNDCPESAAKNADYAQKIMTASTDIKQKMNTLANYSKTKTNEWGMSIEYRNGAYKIDSKGLREGEGGSFMGTFTPNIVYGIHTHSEGESSRMTYFTGPSGGDIDAILYGHHELYHRDKNTYYRGEIIISHDGSQYLVHIDDAQKAYNFYNKHGNAFEMTSNGAGSFANEKMKDDYKEISTKLKDDGFTTNDAHDYVITYLLDKYDTGLKLSKKTSPTAQFKEMKTGYYSSSDTYEPQICP